ncbi:hypothetical protein [Microbulbifer sp. ZKSA002]|uniref:hypothetical protein n=1 Tax=Microbulbifer sp. ZKSA002 TaxID=3243388 RepID=UPI0040397332
MKKLPIFLLLFLFSNFALAGSCGANTCSGNITVLYPQGDSSDIYIELDADMSSLNCTLVGGRYITLTKGNGLHSEIYSMLLSASIAQKSLKFRVEENTSNCELIYTQLIN